MDIRGCKNYIDGKPAESSGNEILDVISPIYGRKISEIIISNSQDVALAVESAKKAFNGWSALTIKQRAEVFFNFRTFLHNYMDDLAELCTLENGKTIEESKAEIYKGIELTDYAISLPQVIGGENLEVSEGIECKMVRFPLGVTAGIVPFNFPIMIPMWMIPVVIGCGNTFILKPSEQAPLSAHRLAELLTEAGLPDGVLNIVNGTREVVEAFCDIPDIKAVGFVGSTAVARIVYKRAAGNGKRVLALGGAKNHVIIMEDADLEMTAHDVVRSSMGAAGQRCMAVHTVIGVGKIQPFIDRIVELAGDIVVGTDIGAIISESAVERITQYIDEAERMGAKILLDGRHITVKGKENGFYVGPTVIDNLNPEIPCACEEVFGPVLSILRVDTLDEAIEIENNNPYGNGASIFTSNGLTAKEFEYRAQAGMVGINIGIPVPREPFPFGGWNMSVFGVGDITSSGGVEFWTRKKKITSKWFVKKARHWLE